MKLPARYMFTAATIACVAFLLAASVMVYFWLSAVWGVVIFCATMAPILGYATLGGFFLDPTKTKDGLVDKDAPRLRNRILGMTIPFVTASVPFLALLGSWHMAPTRAAMGAAGGGLGIRPLAERALHDFDPVVARAGCRAITELGSDKSRDIIVRRLFESEDEELVQCLLQALPSDMSGEGSFRMQMLASKWERKLWEPDLEPERACSLSDHLRHAERAGVDLASPRLLSCAVGAPEVSTRQCCAQSLRAAMGGASSVASILPSPERATETTGVVERADLLIASPKSSDPEVVAILGLDEPEFEAWSLGLGCESLKIWRAEVRDKVGAAMAVRLQDTCGVAAPVEETVAVWVQTCGAAASETTDPAQFDEAICDGLNDRFKQETIAVARRDVRKAVRISSTPPRHVGFFEAMMGLGMSPKKGFSFGGSNGLPAGLEALGKMQGGMGDIPSDLNVLRGPGFEELNKHPVFQQIMRGVGDKANAGGLDPETFRQAMENARMNTTD